MAKRCVQLKTVVIFFLSFALGNLVFFAIKFPDKDTFNGLSDKINDRWPQSRKAKRSADALMPKSPPARLNLDFGGSLNQDQQEQHPPGIHVAGNNRHLDVAPDSSHGLDENQGAAANRNGAIKEEVNSNRGPAKVVLVAYYRSGSTIMGHWFHQNRRDAFYLYEPLIYLFREYLGNHGMQPGYILDRELHGYATRNETSLQVQDFQDTVLHTIKKLLNCDFEGISGRILSHQFIFEGRKFDKWRARLLDCLGAMDQDDVTSCVQIIRERCLKVKIRAIKTVRLSLELATRLWELDPSIKIVYQIRDPRGSLQSRYTHNNWKNVDLKKHGRELCSQMTLDRITLDKLAESFRDAKKVVLDANYRYVDTANSLTVQNDSVAYYLYHPPVVVSQQLMYLRYEDFAVEPMKVGKALYQFLGKPLAQFPKLWMYENTKELRDDEIRYDVMHSSVAAYKWRTIMNTTYQLYMTQECRSLLTTWNYALM